MKNKWIRLIHVFDAVFQFCYVKIAWDKWTKIKNKKYLRFIQNYYSKAYFFTDCFWRSVNGFILLFIYEKQSDFRVVFEKKMVFKIYIESLKTIREGVPFLFKFQVRNLKLY